MKNIEFQLFFMVFAFLLIFIIYFIYLNIRIKEKKKIPELDLVIKRYDIELKQLNLRWQAFFISIINALIIAIVATIVSLFEIHAIWQMLIAFFLLIGFIYALYEFYGRALKALQNRKK